jgi:hypothetical protein
VGLSWARLVALGVTRSVVGLVVRISAFHADGPGSIPGRRSCCFFFLKPVPSLISGMWASGESRCQCSLVVERLLRKQKVAGSIPVVGFLF